MTVVKDLCAVGREYEKSDGSTGKEWVKVGKKIEMDDGREFITLNPWVNLAGLQISEKGGVMVSVFDQKENNGQGNQAQQKKPQQTQQKQKSYANKDTDDFSDIPF